MERNPRGVGSSSQGRSVRRRRSGGSYGNKVALLVPSNPDSFHLYALPYSSLYTNLVNRIREIAEEARNETFKTLTSRLKGFDGGAKVKMKVQADHGSRKDGEIFQVCMLLSCAWRCLRASSKSAIATRVSTTSTPISEEAPTTTAEYTSPGRLGRSS